MRTGERLFLGALHTDRLAGSLARAGIGGGALPTDRQAAAMTNAAIAIDGLEALEVGLQLAAQIAFNRELARGDGVDDLVELLGGQILGADVRIDIGLLEDAERGARANAVDVGTRRGNALVARDFNAEESGHGGLVFGLALPLLVARVFTDDADHILALHDAAGLAKAFDGCSNFHGFKSGCMEDKKSRWRGFSPVRFG